MAKLFLDTTDTSYKVSNSNTEIFGANGTQAITIDGALTGIVLDANVERVAFSGTTSDYKYKQVGTDLEVYNAAGVLVTKVGLQDDTNGTLLTFANGTVDAKFAPSTTGLGLTVGGQAVATTAPTAVTIPAANIDVVTFPITAPTLSVASVAATATEGTNAIWTVTLANPATTATTVKYTLTNVAGASNADTTDETVTGTGVTTTGSVETAPNSGIWEGTLTFAAGATTATLSLPVALDGLAETGEGVSLSLSNPSINAIVNEAGKSATVSFVDAPATTFTLTSTGTGVEVQEGQTITYTITPNSAVNTATTLVLNVKGQALGGVTATTSAADFESAANVSFAQGDTAAKTITLKVAVDTAIEGREAYAADVLDTINYASRSNTVTGVITDALPNLTLTASATSVNEGAAVTYTVTSDVAAPAAGLTIPFTLGGTATSADYTTSVTGNIVIAAGAKTGTLVINATADNATEGVETVNVKLGTVSGANVVTATPVETTINDTSVALAANAFSLSGAATVNEGTTATYTVTRGVATTVATTVPYTITGTAVSGSDYTGATSGTVSFGVGATIGTITLPITADLLTDPNETIIVTLGTPSVSTDVIATGAGFVTTTVNDTSTTPVVSAFTLTASSNTTTNGLDNVTGSAYNTINGYIDASTGTAGTASSWNLTDTVAPDAAANAALNLTILGRSGAATAVSLAGYATTNVPTFNLKVLDSDTAYANSTSFDLGSMTGLATLNVASSNTIGTTNADTVLLTSVPAAVKLSVKNNGQYTNVTSTWVAAATAGTADTVNLITEGRSGTVTIGTGFETAAVTAGAGTRLAGLNSQTTATIKTVTVTGSDLRVDSTLDTTVTSFDASAASGVVNVQLQPGSTFSAKGGNGTSDVIALTAAGSTPTVTGFEKVVGAGAATFDLTNISGNTVLGVAVGAGAVAFTNAAATQNTLAFSGSYNTTRATDVATTGSLTTGGTVGYTLKTATGSADTLNVTVDNGGTATTGTYTVGGLLTATAENVNITVTDWKAVTFGGITQTVTTAAAATLTVPATAANLTFGTVTTTTTGGSTYNLSAVTGTVSITTGNATDALTYTGGTGVDTVTNTIQTNTGTSKTQTFNLGAGNDVMTVAVGAGATITDKLVVNGEAGDDTFSIATAAAAQGTAATVTLDGGAGTDTLKLTAAANFGVTATIAGIEKLNFENTANTTTGAGGLQLTVASGYADTVAITDVSGTNQLVNVTSTGSVDLSNWTALGWTSGTDVLSVSGSGTIKLPSTATLAGSATGSANADTIVGGSSADTITGGAGDDSISGGAGADSITGGTGKDTISVGTSAGVNDRVVFAAAATDTVATASSIAGVDLVSDATFNAAVSTLLDLTETVANVGTTVTGSLTAATFVANMNTLLNVAGGAGFNTAAAGTITAAIVTANAGDLSGRSFLAVDVDSSDTFTVADFVIEITGSTVTSLTTATFV